MKRKIVILGLVLLLGFAAFSQDSDTPDGKTAQPVEQPQQPALVNKIVLYGMTAGGVVLLWVAYRRSKWGRKG